MTGATDDLLAFMPEGVVGIDSEQRIVYFNDSAQRIFGYTLADVVGRKLDMLIPADQRAGHRHHVAQFQHSGAQALVMHQRTEISAQHADGHIFPAEATIVRARHGAQPVTFAIVRDISEQKKRETALRQALAAAKSAAAAKRAFLANMSHELRTPLNGIIGFADLIAHEIHGAHVHPVYKEYGAIIRESGHHLLEIVNDVLDLSRIDADQYRLDDEIFSPADVVAEVRAMLAPMIKDSAVELRVAVDPGLRLLADRRAVKQMLINLLSNAIKFTPAAGRVQIAASVDADGGLVLSVSDTGRGIPPERLHIVSEPFANDRDVYVKSEGGTGIGLSITRKLVELHGGRFAIESAVGAGTRIDLIFPAERSQPPLAEAQPPAKRSGIA